MSSAHLSAPLCLHFGVPSALAEVFLSRLHSRPQSSYCPPYSSHFYLFAFACATSLQLFSLTAPPSSSLSNSDAISFLTLCLIPIAHTNLPFYVLFIIPTKSVLDFYPLFIVLFNVAVILPSTKS